jgi:two-component system C4-dicarboxylate transport sensor histidine kinase DctB
LRKLLTLKCTSIRSVGERRLVYVRNDEFGQRFSLTDALFILGHKLKAGQITVMCPVVKARHWTFGDVNQLEQVFLNLFSNACDAMTGCATRELSVGVETVMRNGRGYLCCTVRDTGVGIPPEELDNVFRAFHTTKPRGQGKGLGLSISRAILAEHNGEITVGSVSGEGTSFMVYLPVYNQTQPVGRGPEKDD